MLKSIMRKFTIHVISANIKLSIKVNLKNMKLELMTKKYSSKKPHKMLIPHIHIHHIFQIQIKSNHSHQTI